MKIGLISDIHADMPSLQKALDLLDAEAVDEILCAGDLVEKGKYGNEVIKLIRERDIPCVRGNHDAMASNINIYRFLPYKHHIPLTQESLDYLNTLPHYLRFERENKRILLVHGTLKSNKEFLLEGSPRAMIRNYAERADADIVIYGHTHTPAYLSTGKVRFINPGSVAKRKKQTSYTCAILTLPDCYLEILSLDDGIKILRRAKIIP